MISRHIFQLDTPNQFQSGRPEIGTLGQGWSGPEPTHVWNDGAYATLQFRVASGRLVKGLEIKGAPYLTDKLPAQRIQIFLAGLFVHAFAMDDDRPIRFALPERARAEPVWNLAFFFADACLPSTPDTSDKRYLALALHSITLLGHI